MTNESGKPEVIWSHCNLCGRETKHDLVYRASRRRTYNSDYHGYPVDIVSVWDVLQCRGCEEVTLSRVDGCSDDDPMDNLSPATYFPPRLSRRKPPWASHYELPSEYLELLEETYTALHADSRRLAMMGARALIDAVIRQNVGEQQSFSKGLDALGTKNLISKQEREIIEAAIEVGHASTHRGHKPAPNDVKVVIDIVERLIHTEILARQASEIKKSTPQRPARGAQSKNSP